MLSQIKYFRQRLIKYLENHSVTETAIRFRISRKTMYKWKNRYGGTIESLKDRSHRPHNIPKWYKKRNESNKKTAEKTQMERFNIDISEIERKIWLYKKLRRFD